MFNLRIRKPSPHTAMSFVLVIERPYDQPWYVARTLVSGEYRIVARGESQRWKDRAYKRELGIA